MDSHILLMERKNSVMNRKINLLIMWFVEGGLEWLKLVKDFFFLKSSEPTLNKSHVLHDLSFFFPTAGHSYDNHLDNHCHPTDGDDERPHLRHTHTNTWGRREWWRLRGKGMGMGGESCCRDRRGILWVTVGARDASWALGKVYIYIFFKLS